MNLKIDRKLTWLALTLAVSLLSANVNAAKRHSLQAIRDLAVNFVAAETRRLGIKVTNIEAGRLDPRLKLAPCGDEVTAFNPHKVQFSHRTTIGVRCESESPWTVYVPVSIVTEIEVLALVSPLKRGDIITARHLKQVRQSDLRGDIPYLADINDVVGKEASRAMGKGTILQAAMVQERMVVKKGERTPILLIAGNLRIKTTGKALQDGAVGDFIGLTNSSSGQRIEGVVRADGSVAIRR